jgi:hypothetical protein
MKASRAVKKPLRFIPLVFCTAMSAARNKAFRALVPLATSEETGVAAAPRVMSTRTCVGVTALNLMSYAWPLATRL